MYCKWCKRLVDIFVSAALLILLIPVLLLLSLLVRLYLGSPIIFKQLRPGLNGKPFCLYKFRSMLDMTPGSDVLLSDGKRLTRFGTLLRSLSLDELPELINVLKGEMSLVGPRPLLMEYLPFYTDSQRVRHHVRPGITGWAQVNGRNTISWEKKFEYDVWYVENCTFALDVKIIMITVIKILKREGINAVGHATTTRFDLENRNKTNS